MKGHTLRDLVKTQEEENMIHSMDTYYPGLSDHIAPAFTLALTKPAVTSHKWVLIRKLKQVDKVRYN